MVCGFCTLEVKILNMHILKLIKGVLFLTITVYAHHQYLCKLNYSESGKNTNYQSFSE